MKFQKELLHLVEKGLIDQPTFDKIQSYYQEQNDNSSSKVIMAFALIGSLLTGIGLILIIAHNWDDFTRSTKSMFAFLPLILSQAFLIWVHLKRPTKDTFRETASSLVFFSIGASISLISQIYNLGGNFNTFLITWMYLALPLVYLMRSSFTSLLIIIGSTYYGINAGYFTSGFDPVYPYFGMMILLLPFYYNLIKRSPSGNFTGLHSWLLGISIIINLGNFTHENELYMFIAYAGLFSFLFLFSLNNKLGKGSRNSFRFLGMAGSLVLLFIFSINDFNEEFYDDFKGYSRDLLISHEFLASMVLVLLTSFTMYLKKLHLNFNAYAFNYLLIIILFFLYTLIPQGYILANLCLLLIGSNEIMNGSKNNNLLQVNLGLIIISALILFRFFDTDIDFIIKGLIFIALGVSFFLTNLFLIKRRRK